jgi:hypothetical protein
MFSFRPLGGVAFAWAAARRTGYLAAASWLFVPVTFALLRVMPGALAWGMVLVIWIKPAIYIAFVLSTIGIVVGRTRRTGVPVLLAAGVVLLLLADFRFGFALGFPGSNSVVAWMGWGIQTPPFFLAAMAAVGTLCVVRGAEEAGGPWQIRLGDLRSYATACALMLLLAAAWGALFGVGIVVPMLSRLAALLRWPFMGVLMHVIAALGPLLLLPIALREWRSAGEPGRQSIWFRTVAVAAIVMCAAGAVSALVMFAHWIAPRGALSAFDAAISVPQRVLSLSAVLAALSLPALLAKMLEEASSPAPAQNMPQPTLGGPAQTSPQRRVGTGSSAAPPVFGRRGQRV